MSTPEDHLDSDYEQGSKKKRKSKPRACDVCRRKKIRCDGPQLPENKCLNCITFKTECTYGQAAKKRGPPKGYIQTLEVRVAHLEALLHKACPDLDITKELGGPLDKESFRQGIVPQPRASTSTPSSTTSPRGCFGDSPTPVSHSSPEQLQDIESSDDEYIQNSLAEKIGRLALNPTHHRFLGKSSGIALIQTAIDLKKEYSGADAGIDDAFGSLRRPKFWSVQPWEIPTYQEEHPVYQFPDPDLLDALVALYFDQINTLSPLLHRPTFEASIKEGLHLRDERFAAVLLAVCANASRWSDDPRVFLEGANSNQSSGWKWFHQVQRVRKSLLAPPCLYDLQLNNLITNFIIGSSAPHAAWTVIGTGLRLAQDVGAHRRKFYGSKLTVEGELWKRAFWVLVSHERGISGALGRPCTLQDEDIDVDLPVECDDEFWSNADPSKAFKQPPGKPSRMAYFTLGTRMSHIFASALRTIYSSNRRKAFFGHIGQDWEQRIVAEMDSALNRWFDSIPDHLRWDPNCEDRITLRQSAQLHCSFYHNQILIHRPFISADRRSSPLAFSCRAICTTAARSLINIADVLRKRSEIIPGLILATFTSCLVLLLHVWGGKRAGMAIDPVKGMAEVHKGLLVLKSYEERWHIAGALWDVIWELGTLGDLPLPTPRANPSFNFSKRRRNSLPGSDAPESSSSGSHSGNTTSRQRYTADPQTMSPPITDGGPPSRVQISSVGHKVWSSNYPNVQSPADPQSYINSSSNNGADHSVNGIPSISSMFYSNALPSSNAQAMFQNPSAFTGSDRPATNMTDTSFPSNLFRDDHLQPTLQLDQRALLDQFMSNMANPDVNLPNLPQASGSDGYGGWQEGPGIQTYPDGFGMENDALAMWSNSPPGLNLNDWNDYIANLGVVMQAQSESFVASNHHQQQQQ